MTEHVPPPWELTGTGTIIVFNFPREFVMDSGFVPPELRDSYAGGPGCVMIVDYHTSGVGPYRELLFIPGLFRYNSTRHYTITKIYVSTKASINNGWLNWGIPKELAEFDIQTGADSTDTTRVMLGGSLIFGLTTKCYGVQIPLNSTLLPVKPSLGQMKDGALLVTRPEGAGTGQLAKVEAIEIDGRYFPDVTRVRPLVTGCVREFKVTFPVPEVEALAVQG